jgi:hypothetical protein
MTKRIIRIERERIVKGKQRFFLVRWESNDLSEYYTWEPAGCFAEDDPHVCEYLAATTNMTTASTQTTGLFCYENSLQITADPDPFKGFIPPPCSPCHSRDNSIPDRAIPIEIVRYIPDEAAFVVVLADSKIRQKLKAQILVLIAPLLVADFFLEQEIQK